MAGYLLGREWIFYLVAAIAGISVVAVLFVDEKDIDHDVARAAIPEGAGAHRPEEDIRALLAHRELLIFAMSVALFHFVNAAMLPLAGQLLSHDKATGASLYMSARIIAAQLVMIPVPAFAGTQPDRWDENSSSSLALACSRFGDACIR